MVLRITLIILSPRSYLRKYTNLKPRFAVLTNSAIEIKSGKPPDIYWYINLPLAMAQGWYNLCRAAFIYIKPRCYIIVINFI